MAIKISARVPSAPQELQNPMKVIGFFIGAPGMGDNYRVRDPNAP
jgi:hypothetical protein